jgi:hypothetical protein
LRKSHGFFVFLSLCLLSLLALAVRSRQAVSDFSPAAHDLEEITAALKLADIAFSNDARYTRNPSQTDLFSAFQDYPGSIEHFPSGSIIAPPDFTSLTTNITVVRRRPSAGM